LVFGFRLPIEDERGDPEPEQPGSSFKDRE